MACLCSFRGYGELLIKEIGNPNNYGFFSFGGPSTLVVAGETTTVTRRDYTKPGGPPCKTDTTISAVTLTGNFEEFCDRNYAASLQGNVTSQTAGAQPATEFVVPLGGYLLLTPLPDADEDVTVTSPDDVTTYVEGTDYERTYSGIRVLPGGSIPAPADEETANIKVVWTSLNTSRIHALTDTSRIYEIVLSGINEGKPYAFRAYRAQPRLAASFPMVATDEGSFGSYEIIFDLLTRTDAKGANESDYYYVERAA